MLKREEIKNKLYEIADGLGLLEEGEEKQINFEEMDSIQLISIIVEIEEAFDIEVPDEYLVPEFFENDEHMVDVIEKLICDTGCAV